MSHIALFSTIYLLKLFFLIKSWFSDKFTDFTTVTYWSKYEFLTYFWQTCCSNSNIIPLDRKSSSAPFKRHIKNLFLTAFCIVLQFGFTFEIPFFSCAQKISNFRISMQRKYKVFCVGFYFASDGNRTIDHFDHE